MDDRVLCCPGSLLHPSLGRVPSPEHLVCLWHSTAENSRHIQGIMLGTLHRNRDCGTWPWPSSPQH